MTSDYRICTRCVMDTTDPGIQFDDQGVCNHCHTYDRMVNDYILSGETGQQHMEILAEKIRREGKNKPYDCVIGVSGGVDSTFVAYTVKQLGLRPLAVHLDNGWDSELAVKNIEQTLKRLEIDLYTHVLDWEEFKDLQKAFLRASTPDSEIPTDHAIVAVLYQMADKIGTRYVILGTNVRTETHLPKAWSQGHNDWRYIRNVQRKFGTRKLSVFPHQNLYALVWHMWTKRRIDILNYLDYDKPRAMQFLEKELDWKYYGGKHHESIYTRFYQGYILPVKFGFDKRRVHLSSMICSGMVTRAAALKELEEPAYSPALQEEDREYVIKKFGWSNDEFDKIMALPKKSYWDYPSYGSILQGKVLKSLYNRLREAYRIQQKKKQEKRLI